MKAFAQIRETAWQNFLALDREERFLQSPDAEKLLSTKQLVTGEDSGKYWNGTIGFLIINCIGAESEIDNFYNYFAPSDRLGYWKWGEDGKVDFATEYTGQHDDILFLHKDLPGGTPASFEVPNWANDWAGTDQNMFARYHARDHGEEFG